MKFFVIRVMPKALILKNDIAEHVMREREILLEENIYHPLLQEAGESFQGIYSFESAFVQDSHVRG